MKTYKCRKCEYIFYTEDPYPQCPCCDGDKLFLFDDDHIFKGFISNDHDHHIHPKFMDNPKGEGQKYTITKRKHDILHKFIGYWIWEFIREEDKKKVIDYVINKSKKFIGVKDDTK